MLCEPGSRHVPAEMEALQKAKMTAQQGESQFTALILKENLNRNQLSEEADRQRFQDVVFPFGIALLWPFGSD